MTKPRKPLKRSWIKRTGTLRTLNRATGLVGGKKRKIKTDLRKAKDRLWALTRERVFQVYGSNCFTCPKKNLTGSNRQGGHVPWPKSILSTECAYDIRFIRAQCYDCNINKGGNGALALMNMKLQGIDIDELWEMNMATKGNPYHLDWHLAKIAELEKLRTP